MAFTENLASFFDTLAGFAVQGTYGAGETVDGIFDNAFLEVKGLAAQVPAFTCAKADVAALAVNSQITILGLAYYVREKRPDESDFVILLVLEAVA